MKHLIVITGPTASGKTSLCVTLAKHFNTSVISADSRQFYQELSIGTAKPTEDEMNGVVHHLINSHSIHNEVSAADFEALALEILEKEFKIHDIVILTGGSGMFIDALCDGLDDIPASKDLRDKLTDEVNKQGLEHLLNELKEKDPAFHKLIDKQNPARVIRAIEAIRLSGKPYSELRADTKKERPFKIHRYIIDHERESLYQRINQRVDLMMEDGLLEEVKTVLQYRNLTPLNTVGYKELFEFLDKKVDLETAVENLKRNTRRYAKRQLTWFRRYNDATWIPFADNAKMAEQIIEDFNSKRTDY